MKEGEFEDLGGVWNGFVQNRTNMSSVCITKTHQIVEKFDRNFGIYVFVASL